MAELSTSPKVTIGVTNGHFLVPGIQLRRRRLVPKWFGDFVLWVFFHREDSKNSITIMGLSK
jgi:hypothetical protein